MLGPLAQVFLIVLPLLISLQAAFAEESPLPPEAMPERAIIRITDHGLEPRELHFNTLDGTVFFLNLSQDSLPTLKIDFGKRRLHCAGPDWTLEGGGVLRSARPVGFRDFAITCFPDPGRYTIEVLGLKGQKQVATGAVVVPDLRQP